MLKAITVDIPSLNFHGDLEFSSGLNVITGESGSGKSLILEAISHVFGKKTPRFSKLDRYTISAIIDISDEVASRLYNLGYEIDAGEASIFISKKERTTYRINGILITWNSVSSLLGSLFSLVSVDERQQLRKEAFRRQLIDRFVDVSLLKELEVVYNSYLELEESIAAAEVNLTLFKEHYANLKELQEEFRDVLDYIDRYDELLVLSEKLRQAGKVLEKAKYLRKLLKADDMSVWHILGVIEPLLSDLNINIDIGCVYDVISDIDEQIDVIIADLEYPEMSLDELEHIIWKIQRLMRKYDEDIDGLKRLIEETRDIDVILRQREADLIQLKKKRENLLKRYESLSEKLTEDRLEAASTIRAYFRKHSKDILGGILDIVINRKEGIYPYGNDIVDFVFKVGDREIPVYEIASSGELSRILLLLYTLVPPTQYVMVFDEIDAGTSGNVASHIAWFLKKLSKHVQVITSTHSQFIAAASDTHFVVRDLGIRKEVKMLEGDHRVKEIARLIDGGSERAYDVALELINSYKRGDMNG